MGEIINFEDYIHPRKKKPEALTVRELGYMFQVLGKEENYKICVLDSSGKEHNISTVLIDSDNHILTLGEED